MEKIALEKHIHDLLKKHNCVVIPSFGGFISNYKPAYYNAVKEMYFPPSRAISFNKNLSTNDGLLTQNVAEKLNLSFEEALNLILDTVAFYNLTLEEKRRLELNRIGVFYLDANQKLQFLPDSKENFQTDSFGLNPLYASVFQTLVEQVKENTVKEINFQSASPEQETNNKELLVESNEPKVVAFQSNWKQNATRIAAGLALAIGIGGTTLFFGSTVKENISDLNLSSLIPKVLWENSEITADAYQVSTLLEPNTIDESEIKALEKYRDSLTTSFLTTSIEAEKEVVSSSTNKVTHAGYYLVAGCFAELNNAQKLVHSLQQNGYQHAHIFDFEKGLHRVTFGTPVENFMEAKDALKKIQNSTQSNAWLVRK
ncbi:MAG: HU domain-containing protein [Luteibaculaceae bacterium]